MKKLSIIIPVYNEKDTLLEILTKVKAVDLGSIEKEIIIVDDCSTDGTRDIIKSLEGDSNYKIYFHEKNKGKGGAVRTGLAYATGDWVINQDADLEYNPEDIKLLLKKIQEPEISVVYGSRLLKGRYSRIRLFGDKKTPLLSHYLGNRFLSFVTRLLYGQGITDMETCYKMMERDIALNLDLNSNNFNIEPEVTTKILKKKYKIIEIPIEYNPRAYNSGKKISWRDGFGAIWTLIKYKFITKQRK